LSSQFLIGPHRSARCGKLAEDHSVDIVVLIKQVPDTATRIQDRVKDGQVDLEGVTWVVNPFDEYAVEEALLLKEKLGGTVTLVTMGPDRAESALKDMLALGADEAVLLRDPAFEGLGPRGTAQVLAAAVRKVPHEMVWTGWKGVDDDQGLVPIYLAHELGYPHLSFVSEFEVDGQRATAKRDVEGGKEVLEVDLPAVFTAQKGLNEVRYASLKGIMAVKRKQIPVWDADELGIDAAALSGSAVETISIERPPERQSGRVLDGSPDEAARELVKLLHEDAKVL
jgi:electron transfer flavoprotein beta subunit